MSGCPFSADQLAQLHTFVSVCQADPSIIHHPKLNFFKDFLLDYGATLPAPAFTSKPSGDTRSNNAEEMAVSSEEDSDIESDVELDMEGVIKSGPIDESQDMGDESKVPTEEETDQSDMKRSEAMAAFSEQKFDEAIKLYTEAIQINPQSALLFAKRGQVYLKLNKLHSCIKDCTHALELNCDSASAYKFRGRAYRLLGQFEDASHDLCESLKIDYDDQTNEWLQEVKPNAEKLRQHKLGVQRKKEEKERSEKIRRVRKAQEANANANANSGQKTEEGFAFPSKDDLTSLLLDADILKALEDSEVSRAFYDVLANPANIVKYQNNPKIVALIEKAQNKFSKYKGQAPSQDFGRSGAGTPPSAPKKPADDDVGLD